jgi:phage terminase small subunit
MREKNKLTDKQRRFVTEYLKDANALQAAQRAGLAYGVGDQMLAYPHVRAEIERRQRKVEELAEVTAAEVVRELWRVANSDIGNFFTDNGSLKRFQDMTPEQRRAIASVDVDELFEGVGQDREQVGETKKVKLWDKVRALEILAKKFKLLTDRVEVGVADDLWVALDRADAARKKAQGK